MVQYGVPFRRVAETRINEAMAQGEFDNLPGAGQPLDLESYFSTPEDVRMAFSILKNAQCVPPEVELLQEVATLKEELARATDAVTVRQLHQRLAERQMVLAMTLERRSPREK